MKITECPWELDNLGCRVAEISVKKDEVIDETAMIALETDHDYLVMKVETGNMEHNRMAFKLGYYLAETQLTMLKNKQDWHIEQDKMTSMMLKQLSIEPIQTEDDFDELMSLITEDMFSTDRIYLDPCFGPKYSVRRYKNWIRTEWERGSLLYKHYFRGVYVGFSLSKLNGNELSCLLAGCFEKYQKTGIGFWLPMIPLIYQSVPHEIYTTHISVNNYPVWQMYNRHQYMVTHFDYVYVKHIKH